MPLLAVAGSMSCEVACSPMPPVFVAWKGCLHDRRFSRFAACARVESQHFTLDSRSALLSAIVLQIPLWPSPLTVAHVFPLATGGQIDGLFEHHKSRRRRRGAGC
jgi:hypothetical protein